jgi:hypothetical protein
MGDIVVGQELLLGYLMNVLEKDEVAEVERELARHPKLRSKLASLQKQLSSLDNLFESTEPPSDLSQRTCDAIWSVAQNENNTSNLNLHTFPTPSTESNLVPNYPNEEIPKFNTETTLQLQKATVQLAPLSTQTVEANFAQSDITDVRNTAIAGSVSEIAKQIEPKAARLNRRRTKKYITDEQPRSKKNLLSQLAISAVVGIVLAVILYPVANYCVGRVVQLVVRQKVDQLNKNVEVYTQLSDPHAQTSPNEINLTRFGWQELLPSTEYIFVDTNNQLPPFEKISDDDISPPPSTKLPADNSINQITQSSQNVNYNLQDYIFLGQSNQFPASLLSDLGTETETFNIANIAGEGVLNIMDKQNLILNLSQPILISEGSTIKPAIGQNMLIQNDRIFFRALPQQNSQNK